MCLPDVDPAEMPNKIDTFGNRCFRASRVSGDSFSDTVDAFREFSFKHWASPYIYIYSNRCFRCRAFCQHGVLPTTGPSYRSGAPMARPGAASLMESLNDFCGQAVGGLESPWRGTDSLARSGTDSGLKARGAVFVVFFHTNLGCLS